MKYYIARIIHENTITDEHVCLTRKRAEAIRKKWAKSDRFDDLTWNRKLRLYEFDFGSGHGSVDKGYYGRIVVDEVEGDEVP